MSKNIIDGILQEKYRHGLIDFDALIDFQTIVYLPPNSHVNLKVNVIAAIKAYNQEYSSIDYVKKKYQENWKKYLRENNEEDTIRKIIKFSLKELSRIERLITEIEVPGSVGYIVARAALWRLQSSFFASLILLRQSYFYESIAILRLIFEQIAWVYNIYSMKDQKEIYKTSPTKSIKNITRIFPIAGKLYGFLSEHAHLSPKLIDQYIEILEDYSEVTLKNSKNDNKTAYIVLLLVDLYATVFELIFYDLLEETRFVYLNDKGDTLIIDESRDFYVNVIQKFEKHRL